MIRKSLLIFILFFSFSNLWSKVIPLTYNNYIALVLKKNLGIKIERLDRSISKKEIEQAYGEFDPIITSQIYKNYYKTFNTTPGYEVGFSSGLSGKLYTGTTYSFTFEHAKSKYDFDDHINQLSINISQPFLKNYGVKINKSEIEKAKLRLKITNKKIEDYINSVIFEASEIYWQLYNSYYKIKAAEESLQNAKNIHMINKKKFSLGLIPESTLLESLAEIKSREEDLISYKEEFRNLNDKLKFYFNNFSDNIIYLPITKPKISKNIISEKEAIKIALKNRYEILKKRYEKKIQQIEAKYWKNQKMPELNLNLSASLIGEDRKIGDSLDRLKSGDNYQWKIGLEFSYPIGNRINKTQYEIAKVNLMKIQFELQNTKNQIILEVKKAFRNVKTNIKKIEATEKALESAKEKLKIETAKFKQGLSTPFKVFHFQRDYTNAKYRYIDAKTDYMISLYYLKKVMGVKLWDTL